jgi:hypothetical protein
MARDANPSDLSELGDLLDLAERVQSSYESSARRESIWRLLEAVLVVVAAVALVLGAAGAEALAASLAVGISAIVYAVAIDIVLIQRIRRRSRSDRNALREVLALLHELEGVAAVEDQWSPLQRAEFRIRLSRFQIEEPLSVFQSVFQARR